MNISETNRTSHIEETHNPEPPPPQTSSEHPATWAGVGRQIEKQPLAFLNTDPSASQLNRAEPGLMSRGDLKKTYPPTPDSEIQGAIDSGKHCDVTLWRGVKESDSANIQQYGTAGGVPEKNENIHAPTREEALTQVAGGSLARDKRAELKPTEYTTSPKLAKQFGQSGLNPRTQQEESGRIIAASINTRYLTKGSGTEHGWTVHNSAPVTFLGEAEGPKGSRSNRFAGVDAG